jgi:DNA-binding response OmpR family regulator
VDVKRILVVDDEQKIVDIVKAYLEREGFRVLVASDGKSAIDIFRREKPDLMVLDLMLPGISGHDVCRTLRKESEVPIVMLTARDEVTDKIVGLELGADDYITKPFDPRELVARVKAVLRRQEVKATPSRVITSGELSMDLDKRVVHRSGKTLDLTATEFDLLHAMAEVPGRVFSRLQLLDKVQGQAFEGYERTIDSHIRNLRKKIEPEPDHPQYVLTVYGVGYKFREDEHAQP